MDDRIGPTRRHILISGTLAAGLELIAARPGSAGRTRHLHFKVQAPRGRVLTTQLYFPDEPANRRDGLFRRELVMRVVRAADGRAARFDFVLDVG